jgi:hypothetical protein
MLSRCLNPNCGVPFRYLHEGRIFRIEQVRVAADIPVLQRYVESYWLCGTCTGKLKVVVENGRVLTCPMDVTPLCCGKARETVAVF